MVQPKYNPQEALERVKLMMNYDLSKTSTENKKIIEEQTEEKGRFSCIKNYFKYIFIKPTQFKEFDYKSGSGKSLMVTFGELSEESWFFDVPKKNWKKLVVSKFVESGKWECDGNKNFIITKNDGTIFKSLYSNNLLTFSNPVEIGKIENEIVNSKPTQTGQSVAQPAQTQPKADNKQGTPDPSKPQKLRPNDDPLRTTLKDSSIPKRTCIAFIDNFHKLWTQCQNPQDAGPECKNTAQIIERRGYVQRCMNQHFPSPKKIGQGQWGITGLATKDTDRKLLELSACQAPAPSQSGPDSIFRLTRKC